MRFKFCVIGCGGMSTIAHGPAMKRYAGLHPDVHLTACCDLDCRKAEEYRTKFGFEKCYTDMEEMLDAEKPDAVSLVAPVNLTASLAIRIMEKGYPLIMEKPPGLNPEETKKMIEVAERMNVSNQVAFNRRYMPLVKEFKRLIVENTGLANISCVNYDFTRIGRMDEDFTTTAIHGIDCLRFITGADFDWIKIDYQTVKNFEKNLMNFYLNCRMDSGAYVRLAFCPVTGYSSEMITVFAFDRVYYLRFPDWNGNSQGKIVYMEKGEVKFEITSANLCESETIENFGFCNEYAMFIEDIKAGRKPEGSIKSSLQSVEVSEAMRRRISEYRKS